MSAETILSVARMAAQISLPVLEKSDIICAIAFARHGSSEDFKIRDWARLRLVFLWSTFKHNPGNRVIRSGVITLAMFFVLLLVMQIPKFPMTLVAYLGMLVFWMGVLTIFFLLQQGYRALRRRKQRN